MIAGLILRPVARTLAVALILADIVLTTQIPELPDWDVADAPRS